MRPKGNFMIGALAGAALLAAAGAAPAQTPLKVMVTNFSIFAAQHKNLFAKHGLAVELLNTPNSQVLRDGLAKGDHQIAHAAVDNAVAMVELAKADVVIEGAAAGDLSGFSVSAAGDLNDDGIDDLIIGAPGADPNGRDYAGATYLIFGSDQGLPAVIDLANDADLIIAGVGPVAWIAVGFLCNGRHDGHRL